MTTRPTLQVLRYAALTGLQDYAFMFSLRTWLAGWYLRVLVQVAFFALIGRLFGHSEAAYLAIGNAVLLVAMHSLGAVASTAWERWTGTLPLIVASPSSPVVVLLAKSLFWIPEGLICGLSAVVLLGPMFDVPLPWPRVLWLGPLLVLVAASSYALGTFLGALVLRATDLRNVLANLATTAMMAFCGVNVPVDFYPAPVRLAAQALPLTHGLQAVRDLLAGAPAAGILRHAAAELVVGAGWLALVVLTLGRLADRGRHDGSIVFSE
jgi:ABC-2 type transport system permease protein